MKCARSAEGSGPAAKRFVSHATFLKWQGEMNKEFQIVSWLDCEVKNERVKKNDSGRDWGKVQVYHHHTST